MNWTLFWLFLHIAAAIVAFGPTFSFPIMGAMAAKNPKYGHFAAELNHVIEARLVLPLAATMLISGTGLIIAGHFNLTKSPWLGAGIILYIIAMGIASGFMLPRTRKLVEATAGGPPEGAAATAGPPPHVAALITQIQRGGMALTLLLAVIVFLMVVKPGA